MFTFAHMKSALLILSWLIAINLDAQQVDSVLSDGSIIYFTVQGQGEPLYILAGGPAVHPEYINDPVNTLDDSNLVVVVHQRGTGLSKGPYEDASINIDQYCRDIHAVKEKLKQWSTN